MTIKDNLISAENNKLLKALKTPELLTHEQRAKIANDRKQGRKLKDLTTKEKRRVLKWRKSQEKLKGKTGK